MTVKSLHFTCGTSLYKDKCDLTLKVLRIFLAFHIFLLLSFFRSVQIIQKNVVSQTSFEMTALCLLYFSIQR